MRTRSKKIYVSGNLFAAAIASLLLLLLLAGCKTSKTTETVETGSAKAHNEFFAAMQEQSFKFETLSARLNVDLKMPDKELSSRVDLKMVKDSAFQLSVQPFFGIEVFRLELTTDSIKVIDRLNKRYVAENYAALKGQTPIEFNFYNLQALFTNHLFLPGEQSLTPKLYNRFKLKQEGALAEAKAKDAMDLIYTFTADGEEKLLATFIADPTERYALQWNYSDFRVADKQLFPLIMAVQILANGASQGGATLHFSRLQINEPLNMDFSIPAKYKRITFAQIIKGLTTSKK